MNRLSGVPFKRARTLKASLPKVRLAGSIDEMGMPREAKTKGRTRPTSPTLYGSVALPVASAIPPTRIVEFPPEPETVTVCGWGVEVEPGGVLAHAATAGRSRNEKRSIGVGGGGVGQAPP